MSTTAHQQCNHIFIQYKNSSLKRFFDYLYRAMLYLLIRCLTIFRHSIYTCVMAIKLNLIQSKCWGELWLGIIVLSLITAVPSCLSPQPTNFFDEEAHQFPWSPRDKQFRRLWLELRPDSPLSPPISNK